MRIPGGGPTIGGAVPSTARASISWDATQSPMSAAVANGNRQPRKRTLVVVVFSAIYPRKLGGLDLGRVGEEGGSHPGWALAYSRPPPPLCGAREQMCDIGVTSGGFVRNASVFV